MNPSSAPRLDRYLRWILRYRWAVVLASVAVVALLASGVRHLGLANNYRVFFGPDNPDLLAFEAIEDTYTKNDNVFFVVQPRDRDDYSAGFLRALDTLTEEAWLLPYATRVDSITNFQHTFARNDDLVVEDLVPDGDLDDAAVARARRVSRSEPLLAGRLAAPDDATSGVNVRVQLPGEDDGELPEVVAAVRDLRDRFQADHPELAVHVTGLSMINNAFAEAPLKDAPGVLPIMMAVFVLTMLLVLRSGWGTVATLGLITLSAGTAVGVVGLLGGKLDPASASAPVIILTLAVANAIHVLLSFLGGLRAGQTRDDAIVEAFRVNARPIFLTTLTTVIGFLSLNFSDSPPFHLLGNLSAFGVVVAWALTMTILPAALSLMPFRRPAARTARRQSIFTRLAQLITTRPRSVLAASAIATVTLVGATATLHVNDRYGDYFDPRLDIRQATDFSVDNLSGYMQTSFSLPSGEPQGITDPGYLERVDGFVKWLRAQDGVGHVASFSDTIQRLNANMNGDDPAFFRIPRTRELAAQYLLLYELSLPYGLDLNDQIDIDKRALRVDVTFGDVDTGVVEAVTAAAHDWLDAHGTEAMRDTTSGGASNMFTNITRRNVDGMLFGTGFGFLVIALVLMIALRSRRLGVVSLVPNLLPAAMAFGIWALLVGEVGFAVSIVSGLAVGIIVDDTVHFLAKYQLARRAQGKSARDAVRYAFEHVGPAIVATTVIVSAGFAMLGLSTFRVTAYMGVLTSLSVSCALLADFFLLPALLVVIDGRRTKTPAAARATAPLTTPTPEGA